MRVAFGVAAIAAVVATVGDLLMLWVANAPRPALALPSPPPGVLRLGTVLGVVAIPLYAVGYAAAARRAEPALGRATGWVMVLGGFGAVLGGYIHAATAWLLEEQLRTAATTPVGAPLESVLGEGSLVVPWAAATVLVTLASAAIAYAALRGVAPRAWLVANPAVATVALGLVGAATELGRAFLVPAAPNVAHVVFFATALGGRGTG